MKTYKGVAGIRLYPTKVEEIALTKNLGCCRFVYNYYLDRTTKQYKKTGKSEGFNKWCEHLSHKLKIKNEWLDESIAQCLIQSLRDLDKAFTNFFRRCKNGETPGYPKFKSKHEENSFRLPQKFDFDYDNNLVWIPKIGWIQASDLSRIKGKVKNVTIKKDRVGDWWLSACTETKVDTIESTGKSVGIDLGIKTLMVLSNGKQVESFKWSNKAYKKLAGLNRALSKKQKGSKNREKARIRLAKQYRYITRRRNYEIQEITTTLVRKYDNIYLEDLAVAKMVKIKPSLGSKAGKKALNRGLHRSCFTQIRTQLEYKTEWYGGNLVLVDKDFPSSKLCHCCGWKNKGLTLQDREWSCKVCKTTHDRDYNAARNILNYGRLKEKGIHFIEYQSGLIRTFAGKTPVKRVIPAMAGH